MAKPSDPTLVTVRQCRVLSGRCFSTPSPQTAVHRTSIAPVASGLGGSSQGTWQFRAIPTPLTLNPSRHCSSSQKGLWASLSPYTNEALHTRSDSESERVVQQHYLAALFADRFLLCNYGGDCCQFGSNHLQLRPGSLGKTPGKVGGHCFSPHETVPFWQGPSQGVCISDKGIVAGEEEEAGSTPR